MRKHNNQEYLLASQVAEMLGGKKNKWSRQRVHMELSRDKFPQPALYMGGGHKSPVWTVEQIKEYMGKGCKE